MSRTYTQIASRVWNTALLLRPSRADVLSNLLLERIGIDAGVNTLDGVQPPVRSFYDAEFDEDSPVDDGTPERPYQVRDGVALIYVAGELVNRGSWIDAYSGLTAYKTLEAQLAQAAADTSVTGILLDVDSPGGEAAGCMELGALVREIDAEKPVTAFVDGQCCSAAYAIACGASNIVVAMSATVGSIGVVLVHMDRSAKLAKDGLKPTIIQKGDYKTDGTSLLPLDKDAAARIDALLESIYTLFVKTVSDFRPDLSEADVRNTKAGVYIGAEAVTAGLADRVGTFQDAIATLARAPAQAEIPDYPGVTMSAAAAPVPSAAASLLGQAAPPPVSNEVAVPAAGAAAPVAVEVPVAPTPAAVLPPPPVHPAAPGGHAVAALGASDHKARIGAILNHPEAVGRETLSKHLALETELTVEAAAGILRTSARAAGPDGTTAGGLIAEMSALSAPALGPAAGAGPAPARAAGPPKSQWDLDMEEGARTARELLGKPAA